MQRPSQTSSPYLPPFFLPSRRALAILIPITVAALGAALFLRYGIIQNSALGIACEAGEESLTCTIRLAVIRLFVHAAFGWTALAMAAIQLWRPNILAFSIGLIAAAFGLVLYNNRLSALAVALLVLSLARARPEARVGSEAQ